jgi:hypothetical protein
MIHEYTIKLILTKKMPCVNKAINIFVIEVLQSYLLFSYTQVFFI